MGAIHDAAENGDLVKMRELLEIAPELVNSKAHPSRWTPLHATLRAGQEEAAAFLMSHGADIRQEKARGLVIVGELLFGDEDAEPLDWDVAWELTEFCVAHGVDMNAKVQGATLLHALANDEHPEAVERCLCWDANINATDSEGHTALYNVTRSIYVGLDKYFDIHGRESPFRAAQRQIAEILRAHGGTGECKPLPRTTPPEPPVFVTVLPVHDGPKVGMGGSQNSRAWGCGSVVGLSGVALVLVALCAAAIAK